MTVDPGTAISVSDRICRIFLHAIGTACFFAGIELNKEEFLHFFNRF